jgi:ABC-type nitrate/sulfonate/bicarbonate transport system permease component
MTAVAPRVAPVPASAPAAPRQTSIWATVTRRVVSDFGWMVAALAVMALLWQLAVTTFGLGAFGTKSVGDVWTFLFTDPDAAVNRGELGTALGETAQHAVAGFVVGMAVGIGLAVAFVLLPALERPLMPVLLLTQALPVLAVLPLFVLLFGRGLAVTLVITTLAVFFPTFVLSSQGLRAVPADQLSYLDSLDAGRWTTLRRLRLPSAVPDLFAAARVAVPSAMFGAIVAEWLATGDGLGYLMITAASGSGGYSLLWAAVALTTVFTMAWYAVVGVLEAVALGHFAPDRLASATH